MRAHLIHTKRRKISPVSNSFYILRNLVQICILGWYLKPRILLALNGTPDLVMSALAAYSETKEFLSTFPVCVNLCNHC